MLYQIFLNIPDYMSKYWDFSTFQVSMVASANLEISFLNNILYFKFGTHHHCSKGFQS